MIADINKYINPFQFDTEMGLFFMNAVCLFMNGIAGCCYVIITCPL